MTLFPENSILCGKNGENAKYVILAKKCHFHLHQHFAIFLTQLKLLVDTNPPINNIDYNTMMIELIKRFKYSENYELMDLQMDINIIHSRKRHIWSTNHNWNKPITKSTNHCWHYHEENHD